MGKRSLKASSQGQMIAKQAFERTCWTQEQLALEVGLNTRQSVWKFFTGRPIERHIFIDLCFRLNLDWEEIADLPPPLEPRPQTSTAELAIATHSERSEDGWVEQMRQHLQPFINQQCGILQSSLNIGRPLALESLYTPIRIIPHLRHQQWLDVEDLQQPQLERSRLQLAQSHPDALDAIEMMQQTPKVLLLGKPGSGKTTFLKHLANQSIASQYRADCIPIFITLRHGLTLSDVAHQSQQGLSQALANLCQAVGLSETQQQLLLRQGRFLLLLDGLDEVPSHQLDQVLTEIQSFTQLYPDNPCLITCRLTSEIPYLSGFLNVEIDHFRGDQIEIFVHNWFTANIPDSELAKTKVQCFLEALDRAENSPLKELVTTPILLSLLCSVFLGRSDFPKNRAKLYQAGLDILLTKWDQSRGIQRDQTYQSLSVAEKLKLLARIAATTFEKEQYFFEKSDLIDIIADYLMETAESIQTLDLESLHSESEVIIQSIQLQHGLILERAKDIYSFSHLTFQEYLTARKILYQSTPESINKTIQDLATHTPEANWHEVLRLTANMLPKADSLIEAMHRVIQQFIAAEPACVECLQAIAAKVERLKSAYQPAALRAFYLNLFGDRDLRLATAIDSAIAHIAEPEIELDLALARIFETGQQLLIKPDIDTLMHLTFALELDQKFELDSGFQAAFQSLKEALPDLELAPEALMHWWQTSGVAWCDRLHQHLLQDRQIGQSQMLDSAQRKRLKKYYELNLLLLDCCQDSRTSKEFSPTLIHDLLRHEFS